MSFSGSIGQWRLVVLIQQSILCVIRKVKYFLVHEMLRFKVVAEIY